MKLTKKQIKKIDSELYKTLTDAQGDEFIRVIMRLSLENRQVENHSPHNAIIPEDFNSRIDYRKALIAQQQDTIAKQLGDIIESLNNLTLTVKGGKMGYSVVAEGNVQNIISSLELPEVAHIRPDRSITFTDNNQE